MTFSAVDPPNWNKGPHRAKVVGQPSKVSKDDNYPEGSYIQIILDGKEVNLIMPCCGGHSYDRTRKRINKLKAVYPGCIISINIPSTVNNISTKHEQHGQKIS